MISGLLSCFFCSHTQLDPAMDESDVHMSSLRSVCFSPEGLYLATVADDRYWENSFGGHRAGAAPWPPPVN
jgi:hypothetical protein